MKDKRFGWCYWALLIDSFPALKAFTDAQGGDLGEAYLNVKKALHEGYHLAGDLTLSVYWMLQVKKGVSKTFADDLIYLHKRFYGPYFDALLQGKVVLVNKSFGYCFLTENYEISQTVERPELMWPEETTKENIRITQWPGGTHYYAKIGNVDVVVDGKQSWGSSEKAERNALKFLKERGY